MVSVDKELATKVFSLLGDGLSSYAIEHKEVTSLRTAQRLKAIREAAISGRPCGETKVGGWSQKRVCQVFGWFSDYQQDKSDVTQTAGQATHDPVMKEARRVHFSEIRTLAERLRQELADDEESFAGYGGPTVDVWYEVAGDGSVRARLGVEQSFGFEAFLSHVEAHESLLTVFITFKERLAARVSDVLASPDRARAWPTDVTDLANLPKRGHVLVEKPVVYRDLLTELQGFLFAGVVSGVCEHCPQQTATTDLLGHDSVVSEG